MEMRSGQWEDQDVILVGGGPKKALKKRTFILLKILRK